MRILDTFRLTTCLGLLWVPLGIQHAPAASSPDNKGGPLSQQTWVTAEDTNEALRLRRRGASLPETEYRIGAGDLLGIWVRDGEEISDRQYRVDRAGTIRLPMLGRIPVEGRGVAELESELIELLKPHFLEPDVAVSMQEYHSYPVSVLGAVSKPGVYRLAGPATLVEVLSEAGGISQNAGYVITIRRRVDSEPVEHEPVEHEASLEDAENEYATLDVTLDEIFDGSNPNAHLLIKPNDVISVPSADIVYVIGAVNKTGGFALTRSEPVSVLRLVAMAEGLRGTAKPKKARIIRKGDGGRLQQITVDIKAVMMGEAEDLQLASNDILFVPDSSLKKVGLRAIQAMAVVGTGALVWRLGRN